MALLAFSDSFSRHCSPNDHRRCFQFLGKLDSLENYDVGSGGGFKFDKCAAGLKLTARSCFEDSRRNWDRKARAFTPQLARDFEILSCNEPQKMAKLAIDVSGACERQNPLDFPYNPLPEKIAVAVDVDEVLGNFLSALNRFIADRYSLNHSVSEYHVYEFFKIWNCSRDEADICVHEFFKMP